MAEEQEDSVSAPFAKREEAWQEIRAAAEEYRNKVGWSNITFEQAITAVITQNPKLYARYESQFRDSAA